jgi:hypothetical protein
MRMHRSPWLERLGIAVLIAILGTTAFVIALLMLGVAFGQTTVNSNPESFPQFQGRYAQPTIPAMATPLGYQQITSLSSSTALTIPTGATYAIICAETQAVRFRDDGSAPTSSIGMPLAVGACLTYDGNLSLLRFIQQTSSATLDALYYR